MQRRGVADAARPAYADVSAFLASSGFAALDRSPASIAPATATDGYTSRNGAADEDNTVSPTVRRHPAVRILSRPAHNPPPSSRGCTSAALAQDFQVIATGRDTDVKMRLRRIGIVMTAKNQPLSRAFNDHTPAAKTTQAFGDGTIVRKVARQHRVALWYVIAAERHLYQTRLSRQFVPALIAFATMAR